MTRLEKYQELAHIIDKDIVVYIGEENESNINKKIIYISNEKVIEGFITEYLTIDLGYEYFKYCSGDVFWFLHELGHIVNGWIDRDAYALITTTLMGNDDSMVETLYKYVRLDEEIYANEWAYEFIKSNRKLVKELSL